MQIIRTIFVIALATNMTLPSLALERNQIKDLSDRCLRAVTRQSPPDGKKLSFAASLNIRERKIGITVDWLGAAGKRSEYRKGFCLFSADGKRLRKVERGKYAWQ